MTKVRTLTVEMILNYVDGPNEVTRSLIKEGDRTIRERERDLKMEERSMSQRMQVAPSRKWLGKP